MKIIIFSDLHIFGYPSHWSGFFDKRVIGTLNRLFFRKKLKNINNLHSFINKLNSLNPDLVICNGDLVTIGERVEFQICKEIFKPIVESNIFDFYCVPGNHDYYIANKDCYKEFFNTFLYLNKNRDLISDSFYITCKNINFCFINECYPTSIFSSNGYISNKSKIKILNWALNSNMPKILVGHYPLLHNDNYKFWRNLVGYNDILQLLNDKYIDLSICGHTHFFSKQVDERGRGEVNVGSLALENKFLMIDYDYVNDVFRHEIIEFNT